MEFVQGEDLGGASQAHGPSDVRARARNRPPAVCRTRGGSCRGRASSRPQARQRPDRSGRTSPDHRLRYRRHDQRHRTARHDRDARIHGARAARSGRCLGTHGCVRPRRRAVRARHGTAASHVAIGGSGVAAIPPGSRRQPSARARHPEGDRPRSAGQAGDGPRDGGSAARHRHGEAQRRDRRILDARPSTETRVAGRRSGRRCAGRGSRSLRVDPPGQRRPDGSRHDHPG